MIITTDPTNISPRRLLVVDDHPDLAVTLARTVAQVCPGLEILSFHSGPEALSEIGELPVDILITDLMMPEMSGMELIEQLRLRPVGAPVFVIVITAYDTGVLQERTQELQIDHIVVKPFPPGRLVQIVRDALEQIAAAQAAHPIEIPHSDPAATSAPNQASVVS